MIRQAFAERNLLEADKIARQAFADKKSDEAILGWICGLICENEVTSAFDLVPIFLQRYPNSLYSIRVFYSDFCARSGKFDDATHEARIYLRLVHDNNCFPILASKRIIQDGVGKAILLLTAAYTELGARCYSQKILTFGLTLDIPENWKKAIQSEQSRISAELEKAEFQVVNGQWSDFFKTGTNAKFIYELCVKNSYPLMAKRVDLIESNFKFNRSFAIDEKELFLLVHETPEGFVLA